MYLNLGECDDWSVQIKIISRTTNRNPVSEESFYKYNYVETKQKKSGLFDLQPRDGKINRRYWPLYNMFCGRHPFLEGVGRAVIQGMFYYIRPLRMRIKCNIGFFRSGALCRWQNNLTVYKQFLENRSNCFDRRLQKRTADIIIMQSNCSEQVWHSTLRIIMPTVYLYTNNVICLVWSEFGLQSVNKAWVVFAFWCSVHAAFSSLIYFCASFNKSV